MKLEQLIADYVGRTVAWGPIGEQVFKRTYSLDLPNGKTERWVDTLGRAIIGNTGLVDAKYIEDGEQEALMDLIFNMGALPAGRHLAASGLPGRQFLNNCLSGDTKVLTRQGLVPIKDLAGKEVEILSQGAKEKTGTGCWKYGEGEWRKATFKSFGKQELLTVVFSDGSEVNATPDHKWYVTKRSGPVETKDLVGHVVPFVTAHKPERDQDYDTGVLHGFVFGDGTLGAKHKDGSRNAHVLLFGNKVLSMVRLFKKAGYETSFNNKNCDGYIGKLPEEWKSLPTDTSSSYWKGFINGLIAADGTVDESGSVILYQSDRDVLEILKNKAAEIGLVTTPIYQQRAMNPWTNEPAVCWRLTFRRFCFESNDLLITSHRARFEEAGAPQVSGMMVTRVRNDHRFEEVYCAIEPVTKTFVIENSLLTGNCHGAGWDYKRPWYHFDFTFDQLMQGGGVGTNVSNRYLQQMPKVENELDVRIICDSAHKDYDDFKHMLEDPSVIPTADFYHEVEDSREGWVKASSFLMQLAWDKELKSKDSSWVKGNYTPLVIFNITPVRPKGVALKTSGGKAAGPEPLVKCLIDMTEVLNKCVGKQLSSLDAMWLDHHIAAAVIAGGKRRSSRMVVKNWKDSDIIEFINCKLIVGQHWTTNISVEVDNEFFAAYKSGDFWATMVMENAVRLMLKNGEPGFWNIDKAREGEREPWLMFCPNPCGEINFQMWENCNLGHVNLRYWASRPLSQCKEAFRLITRWLIRATFGDVTSPEQREVMDRNRRIGVGFFGFHGWLSMNGIRYSDAPENIWVQERLEMFQKVVKEEGTKYAKELGINIPVKFTTLAPTGTIVCLSGDTSSAQCDFAKRLKRRVRYSNTQEELHIKRLEGYPVYPDEDAFNTSIVEYWNESPMVQYVQMAGFDPDEILEDQEQIHVETSLKMQSMLQRVWADNAISFTINLPVPNPPKPEDYGEGDQRSYDTDVHLYEKAMQLKEKEIEGLLIQHLPHLKGTTMFPECSRKNAPLERVTKAQWDLYNGPKEVMQVEQTCVGGCPVK